MASDLRRSLDLPPTSEVNVVSVLGKTVQHVQLEAAASYFNLELRQNSADGLFSASLAPPLAQS